MYAIRSYYVALHRRVLVHHHALGDLELDRRRLDAAALALRLDERLEALLAQVLGRQVDRVHDPAAGLIQGAQVVEGGSYNFV